MAAPSAFLNDRIQAVEDITGYRFADPKILCEALQAAGSTLSSRSDGNKRLAKVGDTALRLVLDSDGYEKGANRGMINDIISARASKSYLAEKGFRKGLDRFIYKNQSQAFVSNGVMTDTVQAILGAVWIDSKRNAFAVEDVMAALDLSWPEQGSINNLL